MRSVVTDDEPLVVSDFCRLVDRRFAAVEQQETAGRRRGGRGSRDEVEPGTVVVSKTVGATGRHVDGVRDRRSAWNAAVRVFDKRRAAANCAQPRSIELEIRSCNELTSGRHFGSFGRFCVQFKVVVFFYHSVNSFNRGISLLLCTKLLEQD